MERSILLSVLVLACLVSHAQFSATKVLYEVQTFEPVRPAMADLDNDGTKDLVVSCQNPYHGLSWFKLDAAGNTVAHQVIADLRVEESLGLSDLDSDGDTDIVVSGTFTGPGANSGDYGFWTVMNLGLGHFGAPELFIPYEEGMFLMGDMDSDGDDDILTSHGPYGVLLNDGTGEFTTLEISMGLNYRFLLIDLDTDGDLDIYESGQPWYEQVGGTFVVHDAQASLDYFDQTWDAVRPADLDNDGDMDVLTYYESTSNRFSWSENTGSAELLLPQLVYDYPNPVDYLHLDLVDWDSDGDLDIISAMQDNYYHEWVSWQENIGGGEFNDPQHIVELPTIPTSVLATDLDNDGTNDLVVTCLDNVIYRAYGTGDQSVSDITVLSQYTNNAASGSWPPQFADMDQDGRVDMVWGGSHDLAWARKLPSGDYETWPTTITPVPAGVQAPLLGDFDQDGDVDVVTIASEADTIAWLENNGDGSSWVSHLLSTSNFPQAVSDPVDMDQDGDLDLLTVSGIGSQNFRCYRNNGSGDFTMTSIGTFINSAYDLFPVDIDGDMDLDVMASTSIGFTKFLNDGNMVFTGPIDTIPVHGVSATVLDMEGDGDPDILSPDQTQDLLVWYVNDGSGAFTEGPTVVSNTNGALEFFLIDLDTDGDPDMIYDHLAGTNLGNGLFSIGEALPGVFGVLDGAWGVDMDHDGDQDIIRVVPGNGCIVSWENYAYNPHEAQGTVYFDTDQDGELDPDDVGLECFVSCSPTGLWSSAQLGHYRFALGEGAFQIQPTLTGPDWSLTSDSSSFHLAIATPDTLIDNLNFGFYPGPPNTDAVVSFTSDPTKCSTVVNAYIDIVNLGNTILRGQLVLQLDSLIELQGALPAPTSIVGHTITWDIDSIFYLTTDHIELECLMPPFSSMDDSVHAVLLLASTDAQGNPTGDFSGEWSSVITCAWDPNDKQVSPHGHGDLGAIPISTEYLDYTIRFQNTGTDTAERVMIRDVLAEGINPASIRILGASHPLTDVVVEPDAEAVFIFDGIMLPDSNANEPESHGYVRFRVRLEAGLPHMTTLPNTAGIIFDMNPPVITNTVLTTLIDCDEFDVSITETAPGVLMASEGVAYQWFLYGDSLVGDQGQQLVTYVAGDFSVQVHNMFGCVISSPAYHVEETSIAETRSFGCTVYPNPFTSSTRVRFDERLQPQDVIQLLDTYGRTLVELTGTSAPEIVLDRADHPSGLYFIRVVRNGSTIAAGGLAIE